MTFNSFAQTLRSCGFLRISLQVCFIIPVLAGCSSKKPADKSPVSDVPQVQVAKPEVRNIVRNVGQPSFIEAYEQTAIYAKLPAYVQKWNVDIGDRVKKGQEMATLFMPELVQEYEQKKAFVVQDEALVEQAKRLMDVAQANVGQSEALVARWDSEVERLTLMVREKVVDKQVLAESQRQLQSNQASFAAAKASLAKARVDVDVAQARVAVAKADRERVKALNGYLTLTAPYDGIVVLRNANTGDFVLPATGDPSAAPRSQDHSASKASPVYVVARMDLVRVYIDVSESDSINIVCRVDKEAGDPRAVTKGQVRIFAKDNVEIPAEATRCTWALNFKSRTLRTEIDLPNPGGKLLPGMYAYGSLTIDRSQVKAVPLSAVLEVGNQFGCYLFANGKAVWTQVQTGVNDGEWVEVIQKRLKDKWVDFDGSEQIIVNNLSAITDGSSVQIADSKSH
jgi:HlyD family secretion protein